MREGSRFFRMGRYAIVCWSVLLALQPRVVLAQGPFDHLLFYDPFNSMNSNLWQVVEGDWTVSNGYLRQNIYTLPVARIVCGHSEWMNYRESFRIYFERSSDPYPQGGLLRYQDDRNYYTMGFSADSNIVTFAKVQNGVETVLGTAPCQIPAEQWITIEIEVLGTSFKVFRSSQFIHEFTDGTFVRGKVGCFTIYNLWPFYQSMVRFDDFKVEGTGELVIEPQETIIANVFIPKGARRSFTVNAGAPPFSWMLTGDSSGHSFIPVPGTDGRTVEYRAGAVIGLDILSVTDNAGLSSSVRIRVIDPGNATGVQGDLNGDARVDIEDLRYLRDYLIRTGRNFLLGRMGGDWAQGRSELQDLNGDGRKDGADLIRLINEPQA